MATKHKKIVVLHSLHQKQLFGHQGVKNPNHVTSSLAATMLINVQLLFYLYIIFMTLVWLELSLGPKTFGGFAGTDHQSVIVNCDTQDLPSHLTV